MRRSPLLVFAALLVTACTPGTPPPTTVTPTPPAPATSPAAPTASQTPRTPEGTPGAWVTVYFPGRDSGRLAREPRQVDRATPARGALEAMLAGPVDPDYASLWNPATRVLGISHRDHLITLDLSREASEVSTGSAGEALMVEQLIWTVTEVLEPTASVLVTIEGRPATWGHLQWDRPRTRADALNTRLLVSIDSLPDGAVVGSPLRVTGEANVFEATLLWQVRDAHGAVVQNGFTNTSEGQTFAAWSLTLTLPPGRYTLEVAESDPSGSEGSRKPHRDTRFFTVR